MKTINITAINGSPRKNFNTATLLKHFTEGAASAGEQINAKLIHLYDYQYTGCRECYLCKMRGGKFYAQCACRDDLTEVLKELSVADGLAFGAPVFLGDFSAAMKAFVERLLFPFTSYAGGGEFSIAPKKIRTAVFSAMNVTEEIRQAEYAPQMNNMIRWLGIIFGHEPEPCFATDTYQFHDYSKYAADLWNEPSKRRWKEDNFPKVCAKAYEIGRQFALKAIADSSTGS